ncbi:MAG TPA: CAP domain-containing protein [Allosphingosinicella sp.]|nr:CAP domain-containing protein [Allosphingosinicella sp.]
MKRLILLAALLLPAATSPGPALPRGERLAESLLAIHNRERAQVGVPPLVWDEALAAEAASYVPELIDLGDLEHSDEAMEGETGENLAMGTAGYYSPEALTQLWVDEKNSFENGIFPNVSRTGDWDEVGHYTAMVWRETTSVGCAIGSGGGDLYLVCRYAPAGNVFSERVY